MQQANINILVWLFDLENYKKLSAAKMIWEIFLGFLPSGLRLVVEVEGEATSLD